MHEILQQEGIRGLFRGLTSTMLRECPGYACFFGSYEFMRSLFIKENQTKADLSKTNVVWVLRARQPNKISLDLVQTWISGGMAGVSFWMIMYPIDVVKTRTQVFQTDRSFFRYAYQIIETEGNRVNRWFTKMIASYFKVSRLSTLDYFPPWFEPSLLLAHYLLLTNKFAHYCDIFRTNIWGV